MDNEIIQNGPVTLPSIGLYSVIVGTQITETLLTTLVEKCETNIEPYQIVNYSITGQLYMQIIGEPRKSYSVTCHATKSQMESIETAWYVGALIKVVTDGGTSVCYGRIIECSRERLGDNSNLFFDGTGWNEYYKMELKLGHMSTPQPTPPEPTEPTDSSEEPETQETA